MQVCKCTRVSPEGQALLRLVWADGCAGMSWKWPLETRGVPALQWKYGKVPRTSGLGWKTDRNPQRDAGKLPGNSLLLIRCALDYHGCFSPLGPLQAHLTVCAGTPIVTFTRLNSPKLGRWTKDMMRSWWRFSVVVRAGGLDVCFGEHPGTRGHVQPLGCHQPFAAMSWVRGRRVKKYFPPLEEWQMSWWSAVVCGVLSLPASWCSPNETTWVTSQAKESSAAEKLRG